MAFTVNDLQDVLKLLREHPEWRTEVRKEVLGDELLTLPDLVRQNSEDIRDLQAVVRQNSEDIRQNSEDIRALQVIVRQNSEDIRSLVTVVQALEARLGRVEGRLGSLEGKVTETRWRDNFDGRFGRLVRKTRLLTVRDLDAFEEAHEQGKISDEEALGVRQLDVLVQGVRGRGHSQEEIILAVEVSTNIEDHDVRRALERAETLRKVGYNAVPVVAGARMDASLAKRAERSGVEVLLHEDDVSQIAG